MRMSKLLALVLLTACTVEEPAESAMESLSVETTRQNGTTTTKIRVNGFFDDVLLADGLTNGFLNASKDQIANTSALDFAYATTSLSDPDLVVLISGAGEIPNSTFTTSLTAAHLQVTTPFEVQRCEVSLETGESTCAVTTPITFNLQWVKNGFGSITEQTKRKEVLGPLTVKFNGQFKRVTANVNGTWTGHTATDNSGNLQDSQSTTIIREIILAP